MLRFFFFKIHCLCCTQHNFLLIPVQVSPFFLYSLCFQRFVVEKIPMLIFESKQTGLLCNMQRGRERHVHVSDLNYVFLSNRPIIFLICFSRKVVYEYFMPKSNQVSFSPKFYCTIFVVLFRKISTGICTTTDLCRTGWRKNSSTKIKKWQRLTSTFL